MIDPATLTPATRLYLRPIWFAESPVRLDGQTARLGNGLLWFQGYEVTAIEGDTRPVRERISVADFAGWTTRLPEPLAQRAHALAANVAALRAPLTLGTRTIRFDVPQVMGILNMTPDSFSDGGKHLDDPQAAADSGFAMGAAGAAIIDVGGESTRPGADTVWEGDEIARVVPVIERLAASGTPVSIDTRKAAVMEAALGAGASLVNDVSALLHDPRSMDVVARAGCPVILMHAPSPGEDPHADPSYHDVVTDVFDWLEARIAACVAAGIVREKIIVDPGLGFGKTLNQNLAIINRLALFQGLGVPLLLGASRKRMIGALSNEAPASARLGGSVALAFRGVELGAQLLRVHDVPETVQMVHVWRGLRDAALTEGG
ncbi:dihydropteroate synthase [Sphingobium subterraneum]|uniref:dihydropteroate synthase n=1 Tax=Sphingobium subterraneum TaxID=627688 RepID=A0A841J841_9SPHN|nr:dihydropteroate synthase [Sphingobium subterraneum]MBB6124695.1 dihydropteroate synthase [Sphingobium subterraneum]